MRERGLKLILVITLLTAQMSLLMRERGLKQKKKKEE